MTVTRIQKPAARSERQAMRRFSVLTFVMLFAVVTLQCRSLPYYDQAINGQMEIFRKQESITDLVDNPETPAPLRKKFIFIQSVRDFAEKELHLPVNDNYLNYVALDRPYVVWNVFAAPQFSLTPKTWCFPIVGCVTYRGYFAEDDARRFGDSLKQEGYDVFIGGAIAYSTLGWFDDPVLSTFISLSEPDTAALIFHELAHGLLYIKDDTAFNESFATAVEQEGLRRWQASANDPKGYEKWLRKHQCRRKFTSLVSKYRARLEALYQQDLPLAAKQKQKAAVFNQMKTEFRDLRSEDGAMAAFDAWFNYPLNNAQLISVSTYYNWEPAFNAMLAECGGDLKKFYQKCRKLAKKKPAERNRILKQYMNKTGLPKGPIMALKACRVAANGKRSSPLND
ncbi:MAG: aminopeptidase [Deltaproteobacteria bacterium]|jgi:predicted aminopeptidase